MFQTAENTGTMAQISNCHSLCKSASCKCEIYMLYNSEEHLSAAIAESQMPSQFSVETLLWLCSEGFFILGCSVLVKSWYHKLFYTERAASQKKIGAPGFRPWCVKWAYRISVKLLLANSSCRLNGSQQGVLKGDSSSTSSLLRCLLAGLAPKSVAHLPHPSTFIFINQLWSHRQWCGIRLWFNLGEIFIRC